MTGFNTTFRAKRAKLSVSAGLMATLMSTGAWAQNCTEVANTGPVSIAATATPASAAAASVTNAISNVTTAFLSQQGSAFVSAPPNPAPNQPGGGVWVRGVGGEVTLRSTSTASGALTSTVDPTLNSTTNVNCRNNQRATFEGVQVGADIARLNWNGWNVHLGTTAGYLSTDQKADNFRTKFDIPFFGTYLVATYGRFFADVLVRQEYYNITLDSPTLGFFNQKSGAHGYSIASSAGYNFALANNWFIEPSAGFNYTRTSVDSIVVAGSPVFPISGTASVNDITSELGRASVRVGTTIASGNMVWQPFASASVFHEFAGNAMSSASTLPNNAFVGATPVSLALQASTSRVGTYGQYSLGLAGQVVNTGWLGFVRVDYRNGSNLEGWTGNAGLRYQFTPGAMDALAADMPMKVKAPRLLAATNWTGLYVGGFFGGEAGRSEIAFVGQTTPVKPHVFGPLGGGQVGYNWQTANNWVYGIEGDIGAADIKGSRACGLNPALGANGLPSGGLASAYFTCRDSSSWVAAATARIGYSYDRTLYYVRGGAAWDNGKASADCILGPTGTSTFGGAVVRACNNQAGVIQTSITAGSSVRTGFLIGFGTEFDLGKNWSAKTEYNYIDFGRHTALASDGVSTLTDRASTSQVKVGVNYRFGPGAVIAKY